jgi:hypothetical protein
MIRACGPHPFGAAVLRTTFCATSSRLSNRLIFEGSNPVIGGEGGIRTLETLPFTHFPGVRLRPLGHLSSILRPACHRPDAKG